MTESWRIVVAPQTPGWIRLPDVPQDGDDWPAGIAHELSAQWHVGDQSGIQDTLADLISSCWEVRDKSAALNLLYFPFVAPVAVRIAVAVRASADPAEWESIGYLVDRHTADRLGEGLRLMRYEKTGDVATVSTSFEFRSGVDSVVVNSAQMLTPVYDATAQALYELVDTMEVFGPDGSGFMSRSDIDSAESDDEWQVI